EKAPAINPVATEMIFAGIATLLPAVTPAATPAVSIGSRSAAGAARGESRGPAIASDKTNFVALMASSFSREESGLQRIDAVLRVPVAPHPEIIAAALIVHVVVERAEPSVLKADAREARAAGNGGRHHLDDEPHAPLLVRLVRDFVADGEK